MQNSLVYKILREDECTAYDRDGQFSGAPIDHADGFIHLSSRTQLVGTLEKHFQQAGPLTILALDTDRMDEESVKWEVSRGSALFPHLYGVITRAMERRRLTLAPGEMPREDWE